MSEGHDWPIRESRTEYETGWYEGGFDLVEQPDGSTKRYYWARLPPAVVVVALDGDDVLMVRQYRPTTRRAFLELPAGIVEDEDGAVSPEDGAAPGAYETAARRELEEETGYVADEATCIQRSWVATGVLRHERGVVVAPDVAAGGERALETNEFITVDRVPRDEAVERVRAAPANDATMEALLLADRDGYL
ncbi:MAG: NUDIX hydrolase [Halobacteriaceae archaeon]